MEPGRALTGSTSQSVPCPPLQTAAAATKIPLPFQAPISTQSMPLISNFTKSLDYKTLPSRSTDSYDNSEHMTTSSSKPIISAWIGTQNFLCTFSEFIVWLCWWSQKIHMKLASLRINPINLRWLYASEPSPPRVTSTECAAEEEKEKTITCLVDLITTIFFLPAWERNWRDLSDRIAEHWRQTVKVKIINYYPYP